MSLTNQDLQAIFPLALYYTIFPACGGYQRFDGSLLNTDGGNNYIFIADQIFSRLCYKARYPVACSFRPKGRGICTHKAFTLAAFAKYPRKRGCLAHCSRE